MSPDVGAVMGHVDGQIAHDANVFVTAVALERTPLIKEDELQELLRADLPRKLFASARKRRRFATNKLAVPLRPRDSSEFVFQHAEERVIRQPSLFGFFELIELSFGVLRRGRGEM